VPGKIDNYHLGVGGVQLTKGDKHLADNELLRSQNAELILDTEKGGEGTLSKRAGYTNLFTTALSGPIVAMAEVRFLELFGASGFYHVNKTFSSTQLDTLNATPIQVVPSSGGILLPVVVTARFIRSGASAWTAAPQLQIVFEGSTTNLVQALSIDGFTAAGATIDKHYCMLRANTFSGTAGVNYKNVPLMARLSADTNPGSTATLEIDVLYEVIFGLD
jgi:hypothetical protein